MPTLITDDVHYHYIINVDNKNVGDDFNEDKDDENGHADCGSDE